MSKRTALIVPCYNEEKRLVPQHFLDFVLTSDSIDLWFINDGSTDGTWSLIQSMAAQKPGRIIARNLSENQGKAGAIRSCFQMVYETGTYTYVGYIDADLSAPLQEVLPLQEQIQKDLYYIVAGCRIKMAGRTIERTMMRHYFSRIFATYYSQLLDVHNYDTQCGLKLFQISFAINLFEKPFVSRWLFDLEIFLRAKILLGEEGYAKKIVEVPLQEWKEVGGSKLRWFDFFKAPWEVLKIYWRYRR